MGANHDHHNHNHAPSDGHTRAFVVGIILNSVFIIAEVVYGLRSNSLALLADAGHNLSDVLGLFLAWGAVWLGKLAPTPRYTYGLRSSSILAALANAILLLVVTGGIIWEALQRFHQPETVSGMTMIVVAALGVGINGISAWFFAKGSKGDLNIKGAFLHLMADALVSLGVAIAGLFILKTGWQWLDPVTSIVVSLVIVFGTWGLLRDGVNLALHAVPEHIDHGKVKEFLAGQPGVVAVHDLHIWAMSTTEVSLTAHVLMKNGHPGDRFLKELAEKLRASFDIQHATFQIELGDELGECKQAPDHIV